MDVEVVTSQGMLMTPELSSYLCLNWGQGSVGVRNDGGL